MMNPAISFIAQLAGPIYLVTALALLFRGQEFDRIIEDYKKSPALSYLSGIISLVIGMLIVMAVYSWASFTDGVFTIIGIAAIFKGAILLLCPGILWKINYKNQVFKIVGAILSGALGIWFSSIGYGIF